jgi:cyclic pyranopterin phosphate synthase
MGENLMSSVLTDKHKRVMKKLRVSLLDACNFRCVYCMPEDAVFSKRTEHIPYTELIKIIENLVSLGIDEVRLTGGEPTLSPDFMKIVRGLEHLPLEKLALTTNGLTFKKYVSELANTQLNHINFSLDTLDPVKFKNITKVDGLSKVLESIDLAIAYGFKVKVNAVIMKNLNANEILDFVEFSQKKGIEVRFLETMNIGVVKPHFERWFLSADEMIQEITSRYEMTLKPSAHDSTSFNYELSNGAKIGFIASESKPFCGGCSRLRIDAKGNVYPCLFKHEGTSLVGKTLIEYPEIIPGLIAQKPMHRIKKQDTPMYQLGG